MSNGLYDAVSAMNAAEKRLDVISQNLANSSAKGYKRTTGTVNSFERLVQGQTRRSQALATSVDFGQGDLVKTDNPIDLGLLGDGFFSFEVEGEEAYSRDGGLSLTEAGDLVSSQGNPIVWQERSGQVAATGSPVRVDATGNVFQDGTRLGQLRLVDFADRSQLWQDGNGYFHAPAGLAEQAATAEVHSGYYESANVNPVSEMVEMIIAQRHYQSSTNLISQMVNSYRRLTQAR